MNNPDEQVMETITTEMAEYICDNLCKHPCNIKDVEKLEDVCAECKMCDFVCNICNEYNRINDFEKSQLLVMLKRIAELEGVIRSIEK